MFFPGFGGAFRPGPGRGPLWLSLYHVPPRHSTGEGFFNLFHRVFHRFQGEKPSFPGGFSTFSTGFSTPASSCGYTSGRGEGGRADIFAGKSGVLPVFEKPGRKTAFDFSVLSGDGPKFLPDGIFRPRFFHNSKREFSRLWKKAGFPQSPRRFG